MLGSEQQAPCPRDRLLEQEELVLSDALTPTPLAWPFSGVRGQANQPPVPRAGPYLLPGETHTPNLQSRLTRLVRKAVSPWKRGTWLKISKVTALWSWSVSYWGGQKDGMGKPNRAVWPALRRSASMAHSDTGHSDYVRVREACKVLRGKRTTV